MNNTSNTADETEDKDIDNDVPVLPQDTLEILNQFLKEKAEREKLEEACIKGEHKNDINFEENWQLSQFWYSEGTKSRITEICRKLIKGESTKIALLSCPSLYQSIKSIHKNVNLFEYDKRFSAYGEDFVFYDFNEGENPNYLEEHQKSYDIIIADPPFLSEECISKISLIIKSLSKSTETTKIIFCSGEIVSEWIEKYLKLSKTKFVPEHERNLGNEFVSYANFNLDEFL